MPFEAGDRVQVEQDGDTDWLLLAPLRYHGESDTFTVPTGFITDFASSPRIMTWLIPRFGRWTPAAILHDWLWREAIPAGMVSSIDADGLFRRVLREMGVPPVKRWMMWAGVRWGAAVTFGRSSGWWRTAPAVVALTVVTLPVTLVPVLGTLWGMLWYGGVEFVATGGRHWGSWST